MTLIQVTSMLLFGRNNRNRLKFWLWLWIFYFFPCLSRSMPLLIRRNKKKFIRFRFRNRNWLRYRFWLFKDCWFWYRFLNYRNSLIILSLYFSNVYICSMHVSFDNAHHYFLRLRVTNKNFILFINLLKRHVFRDGSK